MPPVRRARMADCRSWLWLALLLGAQLPLLPTAQAEERPPAKSVSAATPQGVADLRAIEARVKELVAKAVPATVAIRMGNSQGSGVIVSRDGYVATAGHVVVKPGEKATLILADGKTVKGVTLGRDMAVDSGMLKITDPGPWPFVELAPAREVREGAWCVAVGHPLGYQEGRPPVVRIGRVLSSTEAVIRTDCTIVAGDSGGPLLNLDGKLIGIHSRIGVNGSMNFHVPAEQYRQAWDRLVAGQILHADLPGKDAREVKTPFRAVVGETAQCVVHVRCDGHDAVLGTVVGPHGWILTKASELQGKIACRLRDGREFAARIVGVAPQFDLAMLKIDAEGLAPIAWSAEKPAVGSWVVAAGGDDEALAVGVIGVPQRRIAPTSGALGVIVGEIAGGAKIVQVVAGGPAEKAGLKPNDVITHLNAKAVSNRTELLAAIRKFRPGESVKLTVRRGDEQLEVAAQLSIIENAGTKKREWQNLSTGAISARHNDFPAVLQHDAVIQPNECGAPLVDLGGKVVGVNIARAGRVETYCVPTDVLLGLMYDLMSGRLAPAAESKPATEKRAALPKRAEPQPPAEKKPATTGPELGKPKSPRSGDGQ